MKLQRIATDSVKRRGFHEDKNIPDAARNLYQMEDILTRQKQVGAVARSMRKNGSVPAMPSTGTAPHTMHNALLMAQMLRHIEETGELADAIYFGNPQSIRSELADVFVTLSNVATMCGVDLESAVMDKLTADELRGYMHNGVTAVTEVSA